MFINNKPNLLKMNFWISPKRVLHSVCWLITPKKKKSLNISDTSLDTNWTFCFKVFYWCREFVLTANYRQPLRKWLDCKKVHVMLDDILRRQVCKNLNELFFFRVPRPTDTNSKSNISKVRKRAIKLPRTHVK